jgi:hypothetical protein
MSEYEIKDLSSNHHYRTELPNIIFEIGLPPQLIGVYAAIKRSAGDQGAFFKSEAKLAKELGISKKTLHKFIEILCLINIHLKKSLLIKKNRISKDGDKDTNLISITDIWPENYMKFNESGGRVNITPPRVNITQGVGKNLPQGRVNITHKEEPIKNNLFEETTTPTPSKGKVVVDVVSDKKQKEEEAEQQAARSLKDWIDKESGKMRRNHTTWGDTWIIPLYVYERLIKKNGIKYFQEQLDYMVRLQTDFDKGKNKKPIGNPEVYLKRACKENYADSDQDKNKEEK